MTEKAGETAREGANYRCERCHQVTPLPQGVLIPVCKFCGFDTYDLSNPRFERRDGSLGRTTRAEDPRLRIARRFARTTWLFAPGIT